MHLPCFVHLSSAQLADLIHDARRHVVYSAPGLQQSLAAALVNARRKLGRDAVRVVLDVVDTTARMGYGEFDAVELLQEGNVDIRNEPGLRTCVLVCDDTGFAFFTPPMLVETQDDKHVGPNAIALLPAQTTAIAASFFPTPSLPDQPAPPPEIGRKPVSAEQMQQVKASLEANPPQRFDLARKVNVFNAFIEFVELRLTGLHIAHHTVKLPKDLVLATKDDATTKRLLTTFKLVSDQSKVAKEAGEIDRRVRSLRDKYTRSLGDGLGSVMLRSKREAFAADVEAIRAAITKFQQQVHERLEKELVDSRKKLVDGLLPAVRKSPPEALTAQLTNKPTVDVLKRYIDDELGRVFPSANSLVSDMRLDWVPKGVTYETLNNPVFQERVRAAFPYEDWDKPFREFEAAPVQSVQATLLFDAQ